MISFTIQPLYLAGSLHNKELRDLHPSSAPLTKHYSGDKIEKNEMEGHVARTVDWRGAYRVLVGRPEGKRPFER